MSCQLQPSFDFDGPQRRDLRREAEDWIAKYPKVYGLFEQFALDMAKRGRRFGMKALAERVRWECQFHSNEDYKVNNNFTSYLARKLVADHPELEGLIEMRKVRY